MITIIVDTQEEYEAMREPAEIYMCNQITWKDCKHVDCAKCFEEMHDKAGINIVFSPVDNKDHNQL